MKNTELLHFRLALCCFPFQMRLFNRFSISMNTLSESAFNTDEKEWNNSFRWERKSERKRKGEKKTNRKKSCEMQTEGTGVQSKSMFDWVGLRSKNKAIDRIHSISFTISFPLSDFSFSKFTLYGGNVWIKSTGQICNRKMSDFHSLSRTSVK